MKLNLGIRRRLAPLMDNDRNRIELLNCLLLTLPGSPIVYYGDEIGMGDNVYLGDRNGVRTPMQWSADRNAGFSSADPAALYLPVVTDPAYHYQAVNVAAQEKDPASLLSTMRRLIGVRKRSAVFGRGTIEFLRPRNQAVLAYLRTWRDETLLIVANLSARSQPVELDLAAHDGAEPVEMLSGNRFPRITRAPYFLSLGPHGYYWFRLERRERRPVRYGIEETAI
jgi:maltose alpha-D-glucosyltransferase/alpha-amylase